MKLTDIFIKRPVLAIVVNLVIIVAGLQAMRSLNVRQYPKLESATVTVRTAYVGANAELRRQLNEAAHRRGLRVHYPELELCTDNGAMIALAAAMRLQSGAAAAQRDYAFNVRPRWPLDQIDG